MHNEFPAFSDLEAIEANYAIQPNIGIFCRLEPQLLSNGENNLLAVSVGIRKHSDTKLALGSKLSLSAKNPADGQFDVFSTRVVRVQRVDKLDLHFLEAPLLTPREESRKKPHVEIKVRAFLPEQFSMKDVLISRDGLKFIYNSTLTSAKIGKLIPVYLDCSEKIPFDCRVSQILYNWWTNTHVVTASFENLTERQNEMLSRMIRPEVIPYEEQPVPVENIASEKADEADIMPPVAVTESVTMPPVAVTESVTVYPAAKGSKVDPASGKVRIV